MIYELLKPIKVGEETISEIELQAPSARGKEVTVACSKMAGFVLGAENKAQLETVKAVQGIDFGKTELPSNKEKPSELELAKQLTARCCMVDGDFTSELIERFSDVFKRSPNVITYLGMPIQKEAFEQLDWQDLGNIAAVYAVVFMLS